MLNVKKKNKRLLIEDESGKIVYIPPEHIRRNIRSRDELESLAKNLYENDYIDTIKFFETEVWDRELRRNRWKS